MNSWLFSKTNFYLFGFSAVLLAIGYILLGQGPVDNHLSRSVAPVILVAVYCVLIPFAMLHGYGGGADGGKAGQGREKAGPTTQLSAMEKWSRREAGKSAKN